MFYGLYLIQQFVKAFDTLNHEILITKIKFYGVKGNAKKRFESYLHNTLIGNNMLDGTTQYPNI